MNQSKKKGIKRVILLILAAALVVGLALLPAIVAEEEEEEFVASILSAAVTPGEIGTVIKGGGTLTQQEAVEVSIPYDVLLTEFLVSNGDTVSAGDEVALADRVSVMSAIAQVQETLEYLNEQIQDARDSETNATVTASAGGKVKQIYAGAGDNVQDVMAQYGALAVLSLDSMMAVQIDRSSELSAGDSVVVTFSDETEVTGWVESNIGGTLTVTISDEGYEVGEYVMITTADGQRLGAGELYIHNAWYATAISGVVSRVNVSVNDTVVSGRTLMTLTDTEYTAEFESLCARRREYEEVMLELFRLYQNLAVVAECDGVISGIDENSAYLLSDSGSGAYLSWLTNAPNGDDGQQYRNYLTEVAAVGAQDWALYVNPNYLEITDYKTMSDMQIDTMAMTELVLYTCEAPVYELDETGDGWKQIESAQIHEGDILLFAQNVDGEVVWIVRIYAAEVEDEEPDEFPGEEDSSEEKDPEDQSGLEDIGGSMGGVQQETVVTMYSLERNVILSVTGQETMTLSFSVDEMDILDLYLGQRVSVSVDSLGSGSFGAYVSEIGDTGESSGGNSKFTVTVTLDRAEDMWDGMSATVTVPMEEPHAGLVIPVEALYESGSKTYVYTGYDEAAGEFIGRVEVETGVSDGEMVLILSGLSEGDTVWYAYYDTLDISTAQAEGSSALPGFSFGR